MKITHSIESVSMELADFIAGKALEKAVELKFAICVWIVDPAGNPVIFKRQDNSPLISIDTARKKAMTAVGFGMPTGQAWHDFIKDDPVLSGGIPQMKDFILLGGGSPIMHNNTIIGAIGVSGGHYRQDEMCVKYALTFLE